MEAWQGSGAPYQPACLDSAGDRGRDTHPEAERSSPPPSDFTPRPALTASGVHGGARGGASSLSYKFPPARHDVESASHPIPHHPPASIFARQRTQRIALRRRMRTRTPGICILPVDSAFGIWSGTPSGSTSTEALDGRAFRVCPVARLIWGGFGVGRIFFGAGRAHGWSPPPPNHC
ncbi:hypothetical protein B0H17DRAFT_1334248 [Mycena rosella]|uniref:Uncharacterized protein n=1 Tax=Mycena rosella TaxID=1033263 RepID=A0AAD7GCW8_MYCRO|nr:hypothetical protein B0H17DRAFT_1334248 [Mycena rosella]